MPIPAEDPHSSLLKDKPMFRQYLGNNERSEMHKPGSLIMPPKVVAMWDTEIDRESFDARPSNHRNDGSSTTFSPKIGLMGGTGRQNTQQTTRKTRSSNRKTAAEKVTKDSKFKKPAKDSSKVKKVKAAIAKTDNGTSELKDLSTSKTKTHNQKLQMFIDEPTNEPPTKPDKVPIPVFDPYEEVWHDKGPNRIYLPDSHFATNMMSAEVEWDLAQGKHCEIDIFPFTNMSFAVS